jgi:hypothetical protein
MDLDDARDAWRAGGDTGDAGHTASSADVLREARQARIPGALNPLVRGQLVALLLGFATTLLGGAYLSRVWPMAWQSAIAMALILQGAATMGFALRLRVGVASLDVTAPALTLHRAVTALRRWFVIGGMSVGLSWLFIWPLVLAAALAVWADTDLVTKSPDFLQRVVGSGVAAHAVALVVISRFAAGPLGHARIERWFSARGIDESLRMLEPFD